MALNLLVKYKIYSVYSARKNTLVYQEQKICVAKKN